MAKSPNGGRRTVKRLGNKAIASAGQGQLASIKLGNKILLAKAEEYSIVVVDLSESDRYIFVFVFVTSLSIQYTFLCLIASIFWTKNKKSCGKMLC